MNNSYTEYTRRNCSRSKQKNYALELESIILSFSDMDAYRYEREFVKVIEELAEAQGLKDAQLARIAWPHQKGAAVAWRRMRNNEENPKRLNIEEAVLLTQALGVSMADVCGMVNGRMLKIQQNSIQEQEPAKKAIA